MVTSQAMTGYSTCASWGRWIPQAAPGTWYLAVWGEGGRVFGMLARQLAVIDDFGDLVPVGGASCA